MPRRDDGGLIWIVLRYCRGGQMAREMLFVGLAAVDECWSCVGEDIDADGGDVFGGLVGSDIEIFFEEFE